MGRTYPTEMPTDLAALHEALSTQLEWLREYWRSVTTLFGTDDDTLDVLQADAPAFFVQVQYAFTREIVLGLARLFDKRTTGQDNLVLIRVLDHEAVRSRPALREELEAEFRDAEQLVKPMIHMRHKVLAHNELKEALRDAGDIMQGPTRESIEAALLGVGAFLNQLIRDFGGRPITYTHLAAGQVFGADALVAALRR